MPFWLYGRDSITGQPTDPFFSAAATEEAARSEATAQGMLVDSVEAHLDPQGAWPTRTDNESSAAPIEFTTSDASEHSYEFTGEQIETIRSLASYMRVVAVAGVLMGLVALLAGFVSHRRGGEFLIHGLLLVIIGSLTYSAASAFMRTVETRGRDIENLMDALRRLKSVYAIQVWVMGIALAMLVVVLLLLVLLHPGWR